ncbi:MAG: type II toxin-antitoxin system RelB/DinJ family antitoxin [Chlamydiae bacterium]|nr:type II toxin-antitoxin system RelB/DinJ family antitoxin [Chlamydiota bacterium]MBI3265523.1 type II toxin-antitoxin system RelB/DinJ family antitoxin [Chlamydiota bacterium]
MNKTATIHARIEPHLKNEAEGLLHRLGLSVSQAVTIFYKQITLRRGLPFDVSIPNRNTLKTFTNTDAKRDLIVCRDTNDMFKRLGI